MDECSLLISFDPPVGVPGQSRHHNVLDLSLRVGYFFQSQAVVFNDGYSDLMAGV